MTAARALVLLIVALVIAPLAAGEQATGKVYRIGRIWTGSCAASIFPIYHRALVEGLREQGWTEGRNVTIEYRCAEGNQDRLARLAAELVQLHVDVLITVGNSAARAAQHATTTVPTVIWASRPVEEGLVASLARPGGNLTGVSVDPTPEFYAKQLALLKETVPAAARVGVLSASQVVSSVLQHAGAELGIELEGFQAVQPSEIERAFALMVQKRVEALWVGPTPEHASHREQIVKLAATYRLPAIYAIPDYLQVGGLMSYAPSYLHMMQRIGVYAGRILHGADPATLPVEQPTKFELVINMKTAKALGLTIPPAVLVRADEIIE